MKKSIVLFETEYVLLLSMLLIEKFDKNAIFIHGNKYLDKRFRDSNLKLNNIYITYEDYKEKIKFKKNLENEEYSLKEKYLDEFYEIIMKKFPWWMDITYEYLGQDHMYVTDLFWSRIDKFNVIEDGLGSYTLNLYRKERDGHSLSKKIDKIYLTGLSSIPKSIENKVDIIDLKKMWIQKSFEEKNKILDFFGLDKKNIEKLKNKKVIFFTQTISESGLLTLEEEIELYKKILRNYKDEDILIKIHPRDTKNYKKYFPKLDIDDTRIPFELYELLGMEFDTFATVFSSVVVTLKNSKKIDFYGTKAHYKLLDKLGNYELKYNEDNKPFIKIE